MDKLKKVFSPGSSKDDEVLYGDEAARRASATASSEQDTAKLHPIPGAEKEPGVLRQVLNPGGHKHDDVAHGTTATTEKPDSSDVQPSSGDRNNSIAQQILNPGGQKYDPERFGAPEETTSAGPHATRTDILETDPNEKKHEPGVLRQILNPGGKNYNNEGYGNTAHVVGDSSSATDASRSQPTTTHATRGQATPSGISGSQNTTGETSHLGRDAAIAGTGVAGYEATQHHPQTTESSHSSGPTDSTRTGHAQAAPLTSNITSHTSSGNTYNSDTTPSATAGRDAAIGAGAGAVGGAAAYGAHYTTRDNDESGRPVQPYQSQASTTNPLTSGSSYPSQSASSNVLGGSNAPTSTYGTGSSLNSSNAPSTNLGGSTATSTGDSHLGRDAAILGGTGLAGGAAAYELNKSRNEPSRSEQTGLSQHTPTASSTADGSTDPSLSDGSILNRPHPLPGGATADSTTSTMFGGPGFDRERGIHQPGQGIDASADGLSESTPSANTSGQGLQGPHSTITANKLDLHVPGEFPTEEGATGTTTGTTAGSSTGVGASNLTTGHGSSQQSSTLGDEQSRHTGRDLAAGAAAGAGAGALASGLSGHGSSTQNPADHTATQSSRTTDTYPSSAKTTTGEGASGLTSTQAPTTHAPTSGVISGASNPVPSHTTSANTRASPEHTSASASHEASHQQPKHHANHFLGGFGGPMAGATLGGRDLGEGPEEDSLAASHHSKAAKHQGGVYDNTAEAAVGAGAAGIAAREAMKSHGDTGPASKTLGPHESNLANIVDPRVKPEPSKMKDHTTTEKDHHAHGGEAKHHNKLQKAHPEEAETEHAEKKPSLLHRILHPGERKKEAEQQASSSEGVGSVGPSDTTEGAPSQATDVEGRVIEPHTGLPMNVEKYGTGAGGTDGASNIPGHHPTDPAIAGPDWEAVRKANTPY